MPPSPAAKRGPAVAGPFECDPRERTPFQTIEVEVFLPVFEVSTDMLEPVQPLTWNAGNRFGCCILARAEGRIGRPSH